MHLDPWEKKLQRLIPVLEGRARAVLSGRHYGAGAPLADDLVQGTLLKLRRAGAKDRFGEAPDERLRRYAFRVLHNLYIDLCHRRPLELLARKAEAEPPEAAPDPDPTRTAPSPEAALLLAEAQKTRGRLLTRALDVLSERECDFLAAVLRCGSAPRAQSELGWPPGTASNACQRRTQILKRLQARVAELQADRENGGGA